MTNNKNKRSFLSTIGLLTSFIGMAGLVLSIISLLPLNGYNIYTTIITTINLLQFEHERTNQEWKDLQLSQDAQIYLIFLLGSFLSSLFEIVLTFAACFRHQHRSVHEEDTYDRQYQKQLQQHQQQEEEEEQAVEQDYYKKNRRLSRKSWFIRIACFTLLIQVVFSLFGKNRQFYSHNLSNP
jgi:cytochrome c biogenesis protein CcdA